MKKSTIWILGIVMGLSFLSLIYLQVSYIEEMVKMRREQFEESVQRSIEQACRNIELVETRKYLEEDAAAANCASIRAAAAACAASILRWRVRFGLTSLTIVEKNLTLHGGEDRQKNRHGQTSSPIRALFRLFNG